MKLERVLLAGAVAMTLCACVGANDPAPTATVTVTETVQAPLPEGEDMEVDMEADGDANSDESSTGNSGSFGEEITLPDNEGTIIISDPKPFEPTDIASTSGEWDEFVVMEVTERNDSDEPVPGGWALTATTGEVEAERIFDEGIDSPTSDVMPGKTIKYKAAFGRKKGQDFVVQAAPLTGWSTAYIQ